MSSFNLFILTILGWFLDGWLGNITFGSPLSHEKSWQVNQ